MFDRATDRMAAVLAWLVRFPGHLIEGLFGVYVLGLGIVYLASPEMFDLDVFRYLREGRLDQPWHYGVVFVGIGLAQVVAAWRAESRGRGGWLALRFAAGVLGAAALAGIAQLFAPTGAWTGPYTYGCGALLEALLVARLSVLWLWFRQGVSIRSSYDVEVKARGRKACVQDAPTHSMQASHA